MPVFWRVAARGANEKGSSIELPPELFLQYHLRFAAAQCNKANGRETQHWQGRR